MSPFPTPPKTLALGLAALALSGCVGGNPLVHSERVRIRTDPPGAVATSEYGDSCTTPCRLRLRTSRGGLIRVVHSGFEPIEILVGTRHSPSRVASTALRAATLMANPSPIGVAFVALDLLLDGRGHTRRLDTRRLEVAMVPIGSIERREIREAAAPLVGGVRQLSREEVDAILGPPIPVRSLALAAAPDGN